MTAASPIVSPVGSGVGDLGTAAFLPAFGLVALVLLHAKFDRVLEAVGVGETPDYGWVDE